MKKYTIHFHGQKIRAKQGSGVSEPTLVDEWKDTLQSDGKPAIWHLTDFAFFRTGIPGARFYSVPSQDRLFRARQTEDNKGRYNSKGRFLAQVDVQITCSLNSPNVPVGTMNCPPEH